MKAQLRASVPPKPYVSPYKRFTLILAGCIIIVGAALYGLCYGLMQYYTIRDTVQLTQGAVEEHFAKIPAFIKLLAPEEETNAAEHSGHEGHEGYEGYEGYEGHEGHDMGGADAVQLYEAQPSPTQPMDEDRFQQLKMTVSMHFNLYRIEQARFYGNNGLVKFSYAKEEIATNIAQASRADFKNAADGNVIHKRMGDHNLQVWVPIRHEGRVIGVVETVRDIGNEDSRLNVILISLLAAIIAAMGLLFFSLRHVMIRSNRTIDEQNAELQKLIRLTERTYDESLQALSGALDSRDSETQGHSYRVTAYAVRLGKEMGLSQPELTALARGALLHDVGKIGVPDAILRKPGKLTEEEWETMRSHVQIGYGMLRHIEFLQPALDVVRYHHERWDGTGYPHRLRGEQIPIGAAIFALCDTYDAITSDRPYRGGKSYEEAKAEIVKASGSQLNDKVVSAFLRIPEREWTGIREQNESGQDQPPLDSLFQ